MLINILYWLFGFVAFLPNPFYLGVIPILISIAFISNKYLLINFGRYVIISFIFIFILFSISCISIYFSIDYEAFKFTYRLLFTIIVLSIALFSFYNYHRNAQKIVHYGIISFSAINATMVIITALLPSLYHTLHIDLFSGFNKSVHYFRSPGLTVGFDTSGFISLLAIVLVFLHINQISSLLKNILLLILSTSIIFSSRTSMIAYLILIFLMLFFQKKHKYPNLKDGKIVLLPFIPILLFLLYLLTFFFTGDMPFDNGIIIKIIKGPISNIYSQGDEYSRQYELFNSFTFMPVGMSPVDNFMGKILGATGIMGLFTSIIYLIFLFIIYIKLKNIIHPYIIILFLLQLIFNLKNNYFFTGGSNILNIFYIATISSHIKNANILNKFNSTEYGKITN